MHTNPTIRRDRRGASVIRRASGTRGIGILATAVLAILFLFAALWPRADAECGPAEPKSDPAGQDGGKAGQEGGAPSSPEALFDEILAKFEKEKGLEPWSRMGTVEEFGKVPSKKSVDFLVGIYRSEENPGIHIAASKALARIGTPEALEALLRAGLPLIVEDPLAIQEVGRALSHSFAPEAEDWLLKNAFTPEVRKSPEAYNLMLRAIAKLKDPKKSQVLLAELKGQRIPKEVQVSILEALRASADKRVAQAVLPLLRSTDPEIEIGAYEIIAAVGDASYRTHFAKGIKSPRWEVRALCVDALSKAGDKDLLKLSIPLLSDRDKRVRISVVEALLRHGGPDVIEPLLKAIDGSDPRVQDDIADALARLTGQNFGPVSAQWESWWALNKGRGLALKALSGEDFAALKEEDRERSKTVYFGLRVVSNHLGFLIDTSESMGEEYTPKEAAKKAPDGEGKGKTVVVEKKKKTTAKKSGRSGVTTRLDVAKKELTGVVANLRDSQALNVLSFNTLITDFVHTALGPPGAEEAKSLAKLVPAVRARLAQFTGRLSPGGMTNLLGAIETAMQYSELDTIYLLSDGAPTVGVTDHGQLLAEVERLNRRRRVKINTISFDPEPEERRLLQALSDQNFGVYVEK